MMRQMMHPYHGRHGQPREGGSVPGEREIRVDAVSWAAFLIWVGSAWLANLELGYILVGAGILILLAQAARHFFEFEIEGFWILIGCGFFAAGYWELWDLGIPLGPIILLVAGIGLLIRQFLPRLH